MLSKENLLEVIPKRIQNSITDETLDRINALVNMDPDVEESFKDNILGFKEVLMNGGKCTTSKYLEACLYVSFRLLGANKINAYSKVYPKKMLKYAEAGTRQNYIAGIITGYDRSKLVQQMLAQTIVPCHVMFQNEFFKAINVQVSMMTDDNVSDTVRQKAADSLMGHLKAPEITEVKLDITTNSENTIMKELLDTTAKLAATQQRLIVDGTYSTKDIIDVEIVEKETFDD